MRPRLLYVLALGSLAGVAVVGACSPFDSEGDSLPAGSDEDADDGGAYADPGGLNTTGVGAGTGANTGLPCDVQQLLENRCIGCHRASSTLPLLTYEDLAGPSSSDRSKRMAAVALERMKDTARPMPPAPAAGPTADEIAVFEAWVGRNEPRALEGCTPPVVMDAGVDAAIYATPSVCTSKKTWVISTGWIGGKLGPGPRGFGGGGFGGGSHGSDDINASPQMAPGRACLTCHSIKGGPAYQVAGTVYPTAHEPNDCYGVNGSIEPIQIVVTDANGVSKTIAVNEAGNFFDGSRIAAPFHVKVTNGTKERVMASALTAGDCNSCHTEKGDNSAPGRIMAP